LSREVEEFIRFEGAPGVTRYDHVDQLLDLDSAHITPPWTRLIGQSQQ
jgi:hypothetical protein